MHYIEKKKQKMIITINLNKNAQKYENAIRK